MLDGIYMYNYAIVLLLLMFCTTYYNFVGESTEYPQRPGEKMCAYYMTTRLCSFGSSCRFDHPAWVPLGGIPNWKEATVVGTAIDPATLPQRPTEPDCAYFMKTGECKYGTKCRFNHPIEKLEAKNAEEQASEAAAMPVQPASAFNSRGLPLRPGEGNCVFYGKTGSCKYGTACRYNHPEILLAAGGRTGATLQPQQAVYVQSQQQPNVQYQMVQQDGQQYAYPTTTTYQSSTPAYTATASAYPGTAIAYPVTATYTTAAPQYATQPTASCSGQQVMQTVEYVYPSGTTMQVYPSGATTQGYLQGATGQTFLPGTPTQTYSQAQVYPPGTPTQAYPQGTIVQQYAQGTTAQVFPQAQSYPIGTTFQQQQGTTMQTYPPGTTQQTCPPGTTPTSTYPPGTPSQSMTAQAYPPSTPSQSQGANAQTYPPGTFPPGQAAPTTVEYGYPPGQQPQAQPEYVYATQQTSQNGTEYVYATEQQGQQPTSEQYATTTYAIDASGQPTTADYASYTAAQNSQEYAYAAAQAYHQAAVYVAPLSGLPHPQRPGEPDCTFYIKTGECSFGATCKFHHPPDRIPTGIPKPTKNQTGTVKLSLAGLPRREGEAPCTYYMKTGACKFGLTCKYDHPPPQEIIARAVEAVREGISTSYDNNNLPTSVAESQETTPLPPGTDVPPVTAAAM